MVKVVLVFHTVLYLMLSICCFFQVKESAEKFFNGQTTTAFSRSPMPQGVLMPSVSVCALKGHKTQEMTLANMSTYNLLHGQFSMWPNASAQVEPSWNMITYNLSEILDSFYVRQKGESYRYSIKDGIFSGPDFDSLVKVESVNTIQQGQCFTFTVKKRMFGNDNIVVVFKEQKELYNNNAPVVYCHGRSQAISMVGQFWQEKPQFVRVNQGEEGSMETQILRKQREPTTEKNRCSPSQTEERYYHCAMEKIKDAFRQSEFNCTIPQLSYFMPPSSDLEYCVDENVAAHLIKAAREWMRPLQGLAMLDCERPCVMHKYDFSQYVYTGAMNLTYAQILLTTTDITVEKEYTLFDLNAIVASVGGSLGLFLGFSFLNCLVNVAKNISVFNIKHNIINKQGK